MSKENVDLVRALAMAFQRRDHESVFAVYDQEIEWDASRLADTIPDVAHVYRGHDGVRAYWRRWLSAWKDLQFEIQDVVDAGDDVVLLIRNQRQWGRHSDVEVRLGTSGSGAMVFTIRDGKVIRCRIYPDQTAALTAVGLSR